MRRLAVAEEARQRRLETSAGVAKNKFESSVHMPVGSPVSGPILSVVGARIPCMATAFDDTSRHPVTSTIAAVSQQLATSPTSGCGPSARRDRRQPDRHSPPCGTRSPSSSYATPTTPTRLDLGTAAGATDTGSYWANQTRQTKRDAKRRLELAHALDHDHEPVRDAMAAGQVSEEQAAVIVKGVDALPVEHRRDAEAHLIGCAAEHDPIALRRLAGRVLEVVAPDIAEAHELKALERQEALAEEACRFTIADDGHGLCHGRFTLPTHGGGDAQAGGARHELTQAPRTTPAPRRGWGTRSASTSPATPSTGCPKAGGVDATVVVTMTLENLLGTSKTPAVLDTGDRITAGQARRLACEANLIPLVLGGKSEILDQGRSHRFHTKAQRIAIAHRDQHCTAEGCDWPAAHVPRPPQRPLGQGRQDHRQRRTPPVPAPPLLRPQPEVRDEDHPQRTRRLQPHVTCVGARGRAEDAHA